MGTRIANILSEDDSYGSKRSGDLKAGNENENVRKRKHKIIIHSSPFLRCVQTAIGISAGLAQTPGVQLDTRPSQIEKPEHAAKTARTSPTKEAPPKLSLAPELAPREQSKKPADQPENIKTSIMRVEAFLGEWLTPDYFEHITPPPDSVLMVAGAKVDLMRTEDYSNLSRPQNVVNAQSRGFPGGWGSPVVSPTAVESEGSLSSLPALAHALPDRDRSSSLSGVAGNGSLKRGRSVTKGSFPLAEDHGLYEPPVPVYAISGSNPIPPGFVAHARDSCVDVDTQWDSMRGPPKCGDGGEYGEEWSTMHKRFRKGFQQLVTWYEEHNIPSKGVETMPAGLDGPASSNDDDDEDTDIVLILVSHGAGCNALIGALTNQPVLLDVGMASLTMAVRKPTPSNSPVSTPKETPRSQSPTDPEEIRVHKQYDVKIIANTEHLRPSNSSTPSSSRQPSASGVPAFRERFGSNAALIDGTSLSKAARSATTSGSLGTMRRTASIATSGPHKYVQTSVGLWTPPSREVAMEEHEDEKHHEPVKKPERPAVRSSLQQETKVDSADHLKEGEEKDSVAPLGLWGAPLPPGEAETMRELGTKRRWTVTERG